MHVLLVLEDSEHYAAIQTLPQVNMVQNAVLEEVKALLDTALRGDELETAAMRDSNHDNNWWWQVTAVSKAISAGVLLWCEGRVFRDIGDRLRDLQRSARGMHQGLDAVLCAAHHDVLLPTLDMLKTNAGKVG